ncbi:MAG: hypothetical protein AB1760_12890, partial [Pseudomonadota bacterium]
RPASSPTGPPDDWRASLSHARQNREISKPRQWPATIRAMFGNRFFSGAACPAASVNATELASELTGAQRPNLRAKSRRGQSKIAP